MHRLLGAETERSRISEGPRVKEKFRSLPTQKKYDVVRVKQRRDGEPYVTRLCLLGPSRELEFQWNL